MFLKSSSSGSSIHKDFVTVDPTDTPTHSSTSVAHEHKNLPINPKFVFKIDNSKYHLVKGDLHNESMFEIFRIHFMDVKGHGLHVWEYTSRKQRNIDYEKLLTKI